MRTLIIEDEKLAQLELCQLIRTMDEVEVVTCLSTVQESVQWLKVYRDRVDLIFMDIELSDGVSFEIFEQVTLEVPIIFLTAYSEYALQAFKVNSIDYLLKPIILDELERAINKYRKHCLDVFPIDLSKFENLYQKTQTQSLSRLMVHIGDSYLPLFIDEVAYFYADSKYTYAYTYKKQNYLIDYSLSKLQDELSSKAFFRVNRKCIVHIGTIKKAVKHYNGRLKLHLLPVMEDEVIVSRSNVKGFLNWLSQ